METQTEETAETESDLTVIRNVREYGWHVVLIPSDGETPGWEFSIGMFHTLAHPEIVVFGLDPNVAHVAINEIGARVRGGERFGDGLELSGLLEGVTCMLRPVDIRWYPPFLGTAMWYYLGTDFPVLQLIWPDHDQHYPWDAGFRSDWLWAQPLLFEHDAAAARTEALLASLNLADEV